MDRLYESENNQSAKRVYTENLLRELVRLPAALRRFSGANSEASVPAGQIELCGTGKTHTDALPHFLDACDAITSKKVESDGRFTLKLAHPTWVQQPDGESMLLRENVSGKFSMDKDGTVKLTDLSGIEVYLASDDRSGKGWKASSLTMPKPVDGEKEKLDIKIPWVPAQSRNPYDGHYEKALAFFRRIGVLEPS